MNENSLIAKAIRLVIALLLVVAVRTGYPVLKRKYQDHVAEKKMAEYVSKIDEARAAQASLGAKIATEQEAVNESYAALKVKREMLDQADAAAVQLYNDETAAYQARNVELGALQKQFAEGEGKVNALLASRAEVVSGVANRKTLRVYSVKWCPSSKKAREYLVQNNIPFVEFDVEEDKKADKEFRKLKGLGYPFMSINGETKNGFDPEWIQKMVAENK